MEPSARAAAAGITFGLGIVQLRSRPAARIAGRADRYRRVSVRDRHALGALLLVVVGLLVSPAPRGAVATASAAGGPLRLSGVDPITGRSVSLARYAGRPVVINVWGSWCGGCRDEAKDIARFARRHPTVALIGIDIHDSAARARAFYREFRWHHPSIADSRGAIAARLGVQAALTTLFLDRRHEVIAEIEGAASLARLEQGLRAALRQR